MTRGIWNWEDLPPQPRDEYDERVDEQDRLSEKYEYNLDERCLCGNFLGYSGYGGVCATCRFEEHHERLGKL